MNFGHISDEVRRFIQDNINSVEQLEVLLLLRSEPQRAWSAAEVSQRLLTVPTSATTRLEDLQARGLVASSGVVNGAPAYRYQPYAAHVDPIVGELDRCYRERKDTIIQMIFSRPPDRLNAFSDAFRFRRND